MKKSKKSKKNVRRELVKLECQDCGADLEMLDEVYAHCKFCGQKYIVNELLERIPEVPVQDKYQSAKQRTKPQTTKPQTVRSQTAKSQTAKPQTKRSQQKNSTAAIVFLVMIVVVICSLAFLFIRKEAADSPGEKGLPTDGGVADNTQEKDDSTDSTEKWEGFRSETMKQVVYHMFGKPADEVTKEELESIKYLRIDRYWEGCVISYSTEDYKDYEPDYREKLPDYNGDILFGYNKDFKESIQKVSLPYFEESMGLVYGDIRNFKNLTAIGMNGFSEMDFSEMPHLTMIDGGWDLEYLLDSNVPLEQIEVLSLSRCSLEGLDQLTSLKKLYLEGVDAENMDYLVQCTNLDTLFCNYCFDEASYAPLKALTGLKSLYIDGGYAIKDLSVISSFTELENLSITCTDILNIGFVKSLKNLKTLRLSENSQLSNLDGLGTLQELEFLELNINGLNGSQPEYQEIGKLKNLKSLALHTVYELDFLYELDQLEELEVRLTFYDDVLYPIAQMKNLEELTFAQVHAWHMKMEDFALLQELPKLKKLTIDKVEFDEPVDTLFAVDGLEELYITNCSFEFAPTEINVGDKLKVLDLSGTRFGDNYNGTLEDDQEVLRMFCEAATLEKLNLNYYDMTDLSVLNNLANLKEVSLYCCELTKIPEATFQGCEALETLNISMNQVADLSFVKNLPKLKYLDLWEGYVADLSPLLACTNLRYVDARRNPIAENPLINVVVITE